MEEFETVLWEKKELKSWTGSSEGFVISILEYQALVTRTHSIISKMVRQPKPEKFRTITW